VFLDHHQEKVYFFPLVPQILAFLLAVLAGRREILSF
jgi:hypothetical protein